MADQYLPPYKQLCIYEVHKERCFWCRKPLDYDSMHIDHVIPESTTPRKLLGLKQRYKLKPNFDLLGFENLVPSCLPDNLRKGNRVFDESPRLIMHLNEVARNAKKVSALLKKKLEIHKKAKASAKQEPDCKVDAKWMADGSVGISVWRHHLVRGVWVVDRKSKIVQIFTPPN